MNVKIDLTNSTVAPEVIAAARPAAKEQLKVLFEGSMAFTGWVNAPNEMDEKAVADIVSMADEIRSKCDVFLVLGVGGSYMGAKAVIDLLGASGDTEVIFGGYNFSGRHVRELLGAIEGKDVCLCVISKSGGTTETLSAYGIFKEKMLEKYGAEETASRTYVITENRSNKLHDMAVAEGCPMLFLDEAVGGRYSVLTPVGLLPIAVAGIDITAMMRGARDIANTEAFTSVGADGTCPLDYAIARQTVGAARPVEVYEFFDPYFGFFGEWLKQLFGESEGKDGKGIMPSSLMFSRDLHSMGQYIQEGTPMLFETVITAAEPLCDVRIPDLAVDPFAGKTIEQINDCARRGVIAAHAKAGVPVIEIVMPELTPYGTGELIYFFEMSCAVSALLSGVCPFDQPGVEAYKREMKAYIAEL